MVGIILLKDINSGSYSYTKFMIFKGTNYSEINPQKPFSEYLVNTQKQKIVSKNISPDVNVSYFDLISLLKLTRDFLLLNPYAVCLQFKQTQTDTDFRIIPTSHGSFCLPDLYNFIYDSAVYFPVKTFTFKTQNGQIRANPLEADVCCVLLNYAFKSLESKADAIYYQSGGTLYVDLNCIIRNPFLRKSLKKCISLKAYKLALKLYKQNRKLSNKAFVMPRLLKFKNMPDDIEVSPANTEYEALINKTRAAKLSSSVLVSSYFSNVKPEKLVENIFRIVDDEKFNEIKNAYYERVSDYGRKLFVYNHIPKKDYLNYLTVHDIMSSEFDIKLRKTLFNKSNLLRYTAADFDKREKFLINFDGTAYEF